MILFSDWFWIVEGVDLLLGSKDETANAAKEAHHNRQDGYQSESAKEIFKTRFESGSPIFLFSSSAF